MAEAKRRSSYNEAAARITSGEPGRAEVSDSYRCAAHGCPIGGSITIAGARMCFVHARVDERTRWDETTARIRNRMLLVEASRTLRTGVASDREPGLVAKMIRGLPDDLADRIPEDARRSRYALLVAVERLLLDDCIPTGSRAVSRQSIDSARSAIRDLSYRRRMPVQQRIPGDDDE